MPNASVIRGRSETISISGTWLAELCSFCDGAPAPASDREHPIPETGRRSRRREARCSCEALSWRAPDRSDGG